jgi:hypothetical protein
MSTAIKFFPWDDPECEIYENLAWDLPGHRPSRAGGEKRTSRVSRKADKAGPQSK